VSGTSRQQRMQRVPNLIVVPPAHLVKDVPKEETKPQVRMIKVSSLVVASVSWSAIIGVLSAIDENMNWPVVFSPLFFLVVFLMLTPIDKVEE
jgi:hypothetical protein